MGLFQPDLYRSFGIGFALGAALLLGTIGGSARSDLIATVLPAAVAATVR